MTPSQRRLLREIVEWQQRTYNARARRPIEALEAAGLITVDWNTHDQAKGSGLEIAWQITCRPTEAGRKAVA